MRLLPFRRKKGASPPPPKPKPKRKRRWKRLFLILTLSLLVVIGGLALYINSNSFSEWVRRKVIAEMELVTGGRVEIESLSWSLRRVQFEARGVTIHGSEAAGQTPYLHADRIFAQGKIISVFSREIGLRSLIVDHPVVHLIVYPDGTTNQPVPKPQTDSGSPVQRLFDLGAESLEVRNGELMLNEQKLPFSVAGESLSVGMSYSVADKSYDGSSAGKRILVTYRNYPPLQGDLDLKFIFRPAQVEIKTFKFATQRSQIQASGTISNFNVPEVHAQYNASLDMAEVGRSARIAQLQAGRMEIEGQGLYRNWRYAAKGNFQARGIAWRESSLNLSGVDIASPYEVNWENISLPRIAARIFGGNAQGQIQVANWAAPPPGMKAAPERGSANLKVAGLQVGQIAAVLSTRRLPLAKINMAGDVSGTVNAAWLGSLSKMVAELNLESTPPGNPSPQQVPVTAKLSATYRGAAESVDVTGLNLATRSMRLNATGTLGSNKAQLQVSFNADHLHELKPMLAAFNPHAEIPVDVHGRASFNGSIFGQIRSPSARGRLELQDFDTMVALPPPWAAPGSAVPRVHWDSLGVEILYTPSGVMAQKGVAKHGATQVAFSGNAGLVRGELDERNSPIAINANIRAASLAELLPVLGLNYPVTGALNANLRLTGTLQNLRAAGKLDGSRLSIYGEPFTTFSADVTPAGNETQFTNILLSHNGSKITGSAAVNLPLKSFHFDLSGANIQLASFRRLQPQRFTLEGRVAFHVTGSGTADAPVLDGQLTLRNLVVNGEQVGDLTATAATRGTEMTVHAQSSFQSAVFTADGTVRLRDDFPGAFKVKFDHLDFDPLIRAYLPAHLTGHSSMEGVMDVHGPVKNPRALAVEGNVSQLSANVESMKVNNEGPISFTVKNQAFHVDQFHLVGENTELSIRGDAQLAGERTLDLRTQGQLSLKLLESYYRSITSSGTATFTLHLTGTVAQPLLRGHMDITDGAIAVADLPNGLTQIKGRLVFAQDRMQIENLTAHTGGGDLNLGGFIAYRNGVYVDVTASGKDVRLRYPPGISASANANLRYTGTAQSSLLSGNVTVVRFAVDPHFDFAQYLARARYAAKPGSLNPFLDNLRLDVHFVSTPELRVETSLAKLSGDADLRIRGTVANPAVLGRVNIAEGNIRFNGTQYRLERGDITFSNPQVIQPVVNVEMSARVRDYDITVGFHGPVDRLSITYHSDPPLPSGDIIALLAFGRTRQQDIYSSQPTTATLSTSDTVLEQALNSASNSRVQKLFGVGSVKIDPQAVSTETNLGPRVTIEQQIQNNITLTYITNLAQSSSEQIIQVEYNVSRSISVVAVRDQNGILGFEVRIRKRKR